MHIHIYMYMFNRCFFSMKLWGYMWILKIKLGYHSDISLVNQGWSWMFGDVRGAYQQKKNMANGMSSCHPIAGNPILTEGSLLGRRKKWMDLNISDMGITLTKKSCFFVGQNHLDTIDGSPWNKLWLVFMWLRQGDAHPHVTPPTNYDEWVHMCPRSKGIHAYLEIWRIYV